MRIKWMKVVLLTSMVITLLGIISAKSAAQVQGNAWSPPVRLSSEDGTYHDRSTAMIADPYGNLHVFWVESGFDDKRTIIQHASFDGEHWSPVMDVVATQPRGDIGTVSATVAADGTLYLVWTGGSSGPIYFATAPAQLAGSAGAWSAPVTVEAQAFSAKLLIDSNQNFHLIFNTFFGETPGVYVTQSFDQGQRWTNPIWLDPDIPANYAPLVLDAALDAAGGIHVLWSYQDLAADGADVRYAHSLDGGQTWSLPFTIDAPDEAPDELRMPEPSLAVSGRTVFAIWAGTADTNREFRFSTDAGQTWGIPIRVFGGLQGQALGDGTAIDSLGRLHFIGQIRWPQGLYHFVWDGRSWTAPELFYLIQRNDAEGIGDRIHAHNVKLAIGQGNVMVTTFTDGAGGGALYAMTRTLTDAPAIDAAIIPTATPAITPTPTATPSPLATVPLPPTPTRHSFSDTAPVAKATFSPEQAILFGVGASIMLIIGVFFVIIWQRRR